jgi:iron complex outermembrane recepter protein
MTARACYSCLLLCLQRTKTGSLSKGLFFRSAALIVALTTIGTVSRPQQRPNDLTSTSLEDLMNIEVTSVSRKEEKLFQTAAAIHVITQEEIHRSGLTSIPELLRLVPGLDVARIDGTKWAISARGFNGRLANKLLVLIDGWSVYSPETSGVYWEVLDLMVEDKWQQRQWQTSDDQAIQVG